MGNTWVNDNIKSCYLKIYGIKENKIELIFWMIMASELIDTC